MDKPHNNGYICSEHGIGYVKKCPTCAFEEGEAQKQFITEELREEGKI